MGPGRILRPTSEGRSPAPLCPLPIRRAARKKCEERVEAIGRNDNDNHQTARLAGLVLCGFLSWTGPGLCGCRQRSGMHRQCSCRCPGRPGPSGVLDLALVQAAVHDAVQALDRRFEPYFAEVPGAQGRKSAAVAAAAHGVLVAFYPGQMMTLDTAYLELPRQQRPGGQPWVGRGPEGRRHLPAAATRGARRVPGFHRRH